MATLEKKRPQRLASTSTSTAAPRRLSSTPLTPSSPTIIRTPEFILLPSVPTHEPEDNLPSPMAWQQQFALAALNEAQARRSRQNSIQRSPSSTASEEGRHPATGSRSDFSHHSSSGGSHSQSHSIMMDQEDDQDELEEIVEPEDDERYDCDPAASYDALRDVRNQQLDSLQSVVHSIAEAHFDRASSSSAPDSDITQILDDMFASVRRIGGHNAPLSPTFARPTVGTPGLHQMSDVDRLVLLVDRLKSAASDVNDAHNANLLAKLITLTQGLIESERRLARPALDSPPRTPRSITGSRRRSFINAVQQSPRSSSQLSVSRGGSFSSAQSHATTLSTSSDDAAGHTSDVEAKTPARTRSASASAAAGSSSLVSPASKLSDAGGPLSAVPEQHRVDGSVFDMATVRQSPKKPASLSVFSIETLYAPPPSSALGLIHPQSPRSDQASRAASATGRSDSTALPNAKLFSARAESVASTSLPGYSYDDATSNAFAASDKKGQGADDLPQYDDEQQQQQRSAGTTLSDVKKPIEAPTLLERRRAKMAAQHSAYNARTPEDLAMVQSSIDRMSTVMPQLDNQRALSPEQLRESQLDSMIGRLAESSSQRMDDQRSNPPTLRASRLAPPAPLPRIATEAAPVRSGPPVGGDLHRKGAAVALDQESDLPKSPVTPSSLHSGPSSRRSSLLSGAFSRRLSLASIGNALRRASIYDPSKLKPKDVVESDDGDVAAGPVDDATIRRRRGSRVPQDSRSKYDIADSLANLFNDGKSGATEASGSSASSKRLSAQTGFRAIDFADDTPRGREITYDSLDEEEEDAMLGDYSFAKVNTTKSNHRLSLAPIIPDSPRSLADWGAGSSASSRRSSSQHLSLSPGTPTWPKSPLTPVSPTAPKRMGKASVTFAAGTMPPAPVGKPTTAGMQTIRQENASSPCEYSEAPDPVCASTTATATAAAAAATANLVVYSMFSPNPATDISVRCIPSPQSKVEYFAEAQHALGHISVLLWSSTQMELEWEVKDDVLMCNDTMNRDVACESEISGSGGGSSGEEMRGHVRVRLPARARAGQRGTVRLEESVVRVKLELTEEEKRRGRERSRGEGVVEFPLSAEHLASSQESLSCAVCYISDHTVPLMKRGEVKWRALPSEGWEELVDAWMCHADQELNRSLTETAVRFSSRVHAGQPEAGEEMVWVGDTYLLVPRGLLEGEAVTFDDDIDGGKVMRCRTCDHVLGTLSSASPTAGTVVKLSKYTLSTPSLPHIWVRTLLAALAHSAASHGTRRFLLTSPHASNNLEIWSFSRAQFTTSISRHWPSLTGQDGTGKAEGVWEGQKVFFRTPQGEGEAGRETIELPEAVYGWLERALREVHDSLPKELGGVLPDWKGAYLATVGEDA